MRTIMVMAALAVVTPYYVFRFIFLDMFGGSDPGGKLSQRSIRVWGKALCGAGGVKVIGHGTEKLSLSQPRVLVSNHVSWFDVLALAGVLPRTAFVSKMELAHIPFFGSAMRIAGHLFVDRNNHKAAFAAYEEAAQRIRAGTTVVIFPEGTRGTTYAIRPFKKGPFVLAIASGVPIVPVLVHGSIEVLPRGSLWARKHDIHIHVLDEIPTAGCTYDDRNRLAKAAHDMMAEAQKRLYGIESPPWNPGRN